MKPNKIDWTVNLSETAKADLSAYAESSLPNETGGLLIGWYTGTEIHVSDAVVVDDGQAGPTSYVRTNQAGNATLQRYLAERSPSDPSGYLGDWHTHPAPAGPSPLDRLTFLKLAARARRPLAMVVVVRDGDGWDLAVQVVGSARWLRKRPKGIK